VSADKGIATVSRKQSTKENRTAKKDHYKYTPHCFYKIAKSKKKFELIPMMQK